jgi:hypothetical protein
MTYLSLLNAVDNDIITTKEVAEHFRIKEKAACYLALNYLVSKGKILGFKFDGSWRFKKDKIRDWIEKQGNKDIKK